MSVYTRLYRHLLRACRLHDRQPQLKSFLIHPQRDFARKEVEEEFVRALVTWKQNKNKRDAEASSSSDTTASGMGETPPAPPPPTGTSRLRPAPTADDATRLALTLSSIASNPNGERTWRASTSPLIQRCYDGALRGRSFYWPEASFAQIVQTEFRRAAREAREATSKPSDANTHFALASSGASAASVSPASSTQTAPPAASLLTDAFHLLRVLNKNSTENGPPNLTEVALIVDPALESYTQPFLHAESDAAHLLWIWQSILVRTEMDEEAAHRAVAQLTIDLARKARDGSPSDLPRLKDLPRARDAYRRWHRAGVMEKTDQLRVGTFLVAHPVMADIWDHAVILILRHDSEGATGVVVNRPTDFPLERPLKTAADALRLQWRTRHGGPVRHWEPDRDDSDTDDGPTLLLALHRLPQLASISHVIIGGESPVWCVDDEHQAVQLLMKQRKEDERFAETIAHMEFPTVVDEESGASRTSRPLAPPRVRSSDFVLFGGLCTWSAGQLERELAAGNWSLATGSGRHVFTDSTTTSNLESVPVPLHRLWSHAMHQLGGEHRAFARLPSEADALAAQATSNSHMTSQEKRHGASPD